MTDKKGEESKVDKESQTDKEQQNPVNVGVFSLEAAGIFTEKPIKKEITWTNGEEKYTSEVYVKKVAFDEFVIESGIIHGGKLNDEEINIEVQAARIKGAIVDEKGKQVFETIDQVKMLNTEISVALIGAFYEVNPAEGKS